jgi:hypothetical protein
MFRVISQASLRTKVEPPESARMATESTVSIGGKYLGGTARYVGDQQAQLFNASDLVAVGKAGDPDFHRAYEIDVRELRRRLEALGYSLGQVRDDVVSTLRKGYSELESEHFPQCRSFLDYGCSVTTEALVELVRKWRSSEREPYDDYMAHLDLENFEGALLDFIQGSSSEFLLPSGNIWISGYHFERLLCEVFSGDEIFSVDFTDLIRAGYYKSDDLPITDSFDRMLSQFNPNSFRMTERVEDEESEVLEFKEMSAGNPSKAIAKQLEKYLIGFLNHEGGRILYGVTDAGMVEGVVITREQRDELQRLVGETVMSIVPTVSRGAVQLKLRPLINMGQELVDRYVIEISIPKGKEKEMYFSNKGETWVRQGTSTCALKGHQLFAHIIARCASDSA